MKPFQIMCWKRAEKELVQGKIKKLEKINSSRTKQVKDISFKCYIWDGKNLVFRVNKISIAHSLFPRASLLLCWITKRFLSFPATATISHRAQFSNQLFLIQKMPKKLILELSVWQNRKKSGIMKTEWFRKEPKVVSRLLPPKALN